MFEVKTQRLALRDLLKEDQQVMHRLRSDPDVIRHMEYLRSDTAAETWTWILETIEHNSLNPRQSYNLVIKRRSDNRILGWIGIGQATGELPGVLDFGYALLPEFWGQGFATEALSAVLRIGFESLGADRIFGECDPNNPASGRVMEKAGMSMTGQSEPGHQQDLRFVVNRETWSSTR
jgi:ribosomal-protein-alanine N-acetyltransferase